MNIWNEDCIEFTSKRFLPESVDLVICDPPFGISEKGFDKHYNRKPEHVIDGYIEAPRDYAYFTDKWLEQAASILKINGSMYVVSGWTNLVDVLNAAKKHKLHLVNLISWKYSFGVYTKRKYVSSHYEILFLVKDKKKYKFNTNCRFQGNEKNEKGGKKLYKDLEDVWLINKEYRPGIKKNVNKLPDELVKKMIQYSSNEGDLVCDFFLGNFTTAIMAKKLGRIPCGFELNPQSYELGINNLSKI